MKRSVLILLIAWLSLIAVSPVCGLGIEAMPFRPFYWVMGEVNDYKAGDLTVAANGRTVYLFKTPADYRAGNFASGTVSGNTLWLNGFDVDPSEFQVGNTYYVATEQINVGDQSYGASGTITISGAGWEQISALSLAPGYTPPWLVTAEAVAEPAPAVKLWFGNRLYQKAMVEKGEKFIVSDKPTIKAQITISEPYNLAGSITGYSIVIDPGTSTSKTLDLQSSHMTAKSYAVGTAPEENKLRGTSIEYTLAESLSDGVHNVQVNARSSGALGTAGSVTELATVEVIGGPVRLLGIPLTFPSPFSITKQKTVTVQYTLSKNAAIQIIFTDISGQRIRNFVFEEGQEGGNAGLNKVTWNGRTDRGMLAGNGIYVGTIVARAEGRKLGSVKLTVVD